VTKVTVMPFDNDFLVINGANPIFPLDGNERFIGWVVGASTDLAEIKYVRYFPKSGTYRVKYLFTKSSESGKADIGLDADGATNLFSQLDEYAAVTTYNQEVFTTIQISRGFHEIHLKANGKNVSSTAFFLKSTMIEFQLIDEHPILSEEGIAQINQGSMVLLAKHKAVVAESTKTFNLADILDSKFSEVKIIINGEMTASAALQLVLNNLGTNYLQKGHRSVGGTITAINITTGAVLTVASTSVLTGSTTFYSEVTIQKDEAGVWSGGKTSTHGFSVGLEETGWNHDVATKSKIETITLSTSASTWKAGTTIEIYGVKR